MLRLDENASGKDLVDLVVPEFEGAAHGASHRVAELTSSEASGILIDHGVSLLLDLLFEDKQEVTSSEEVLVLENWVLVQEEVKL